MRAAIWTHILAGLALALAVGEDRRAEHACSLLHHTRPAACAVAGDGMLCRRGIAADALQDVHEHIRHLSIVEWPGACFRVDRIQTHFPALTQLSFLNCTELTELKGRFGEASNIEKISIHGATSLWELPADLVALMPRLRELDLRGNGLRHLRPHLVRAPALRTVHLGDNKWDCSDGGLDWLALEAANGTVRRAIVDYRRLMCHQRLYRGKPLHLVMNIIKTVRRTCPAPCACAMTHVVSDRAGGVIPLITVDCAARGLRDPPAALPPSTTTLRLEDNEISSVRAVLQNPHYRRLADLYLDNNSLASVKELEGAEWFTTFRVLSLRGNALKQIPVYAFDKAFQSNANIMQVFLGGNPWRCDCHYTPRFQALLLKYRRVVRDLHDVRCARSGDEATSYVQISTMPLSSVCGSGGGGAAVSGLDALSAALAAAVLCVVARFLYDWRRFRATGELPWISSILP